MQRLILGPQLIWRLPGIPARLSGMSARLCLELRARPADCTPASPCAFDPTQVGAAVVSCLPLSGLASSRGGWSYLASQPLWLLQAPQFDEGGGYVMNAKPAEPSCGSEH